MKMIALLATASLLATSVFAEPEPTGDLVLRGVLDLGNSTTFSLSSPGGQSKDWVKPGDEFLGYTIGKYDAKKKSLVVEKDGQEYFVSLAGVTPAEGQDDYDEAYQEAAEMIKKIRFQETLGKMLKAQQGSMMEAMRQQAAQNGMNDPELLAFQEKAMTEMFDDIDWAKIEQSMVGAYADVFTPAELRGLNDFYSTPAGIASIEKSPQLQAKMMQVMMPEIMQSSMKMQKKLEDFLAKRQQQEAAQ